MTTRPPSVFIVGAAKCGTTTLFDVLGRHPRIAPCLIKEPHHFSEDINFAAFPERYLTPSSVEIDRYLAAPSAAPTKAWVRSRDDYLRLFARGMPDQLGMEASVSYLYSETAASLIRDFNPDARIIVVLRDPVERAISHYRMFLASGYVGEDMAVELQSSGTFSRSGHLQNLCVDPGFYAAQVGRYLAVFPPENICVVLLEDLRLQAVDTYRRLASFLDIKYLPECFVPETRSNAGVVARSGLARRVLANQPLRRAYRRTIKSPPLDRWVRKLTLTTGDPGVVPEHVVALLRETYSVNVRQLEALLDRDLSSWC